MLEKLLPAISVVIGGLLTLAGTFVIQLYGLHVGEKQRTHDTRLRRKKKLEEIVDLVGESQKWIWNLKLCRSVSEVQECRIPTEVRRALMVANLSFPSTAQAALEWANGFSRYYEFAWQNFRQDGSALGSRLEVLARQRPDVEKMNQTLTVLRNHFDDAIVEEAKNYLDL